MWQHKGYFSLYCAGLKPLFVYYNGVGLKSLFIYCNIGLYIFISITLWDEDLCLLQCDRT